jgi:enamine deaminase RidA (YjgF/YER057c/UK114 family)
MSHLQYFDYPNFGTRTKKELGASQAVRVGNFIELSGQGGWDPKTEEFPLALSEEIDQAFSNVQLALTTAGGNVRSQNAYYVIFVDQYV